MTDETHRPPAPTDVRMRGFQTRADVDDVLRLVRSLARPLPAERVRLEDAAGRVLAADISAPVAVPGFARAAMDGYALRGEETFGASDYNPLTFVVIGEARPGRAFPGAVAPGEAVRIMTGAPVPAGADAVVMAEYAQESRGLEAGRDPQRSVETAVGPVTKPGARSEAAPAGRSEAGAGPTLVTITDAVPPGRHVGPVGEDIQAGDLLFRAGRVLRPQDVGVLASVGVAVVPVVRRPVVRLVITGDELLPPGAMPADCRIVDSNSLMLDALVRRDGGIPMRGGIVPDRREAVEAELLGAEGDVILVSGGSSVGAEDHAPTIVAQHGELLAHGIAMRPSSPAGFGRLGTRLVFLLPGNPVSCLCAYDFFAGPAIRLLGGRSADWPYRRVRARMAKKLVSDIGRVDYARVRLTESGVEPMATGGASILSSTTRADGFVIVPRDSEGYAPGDEVTVYLYD